MTNCLEIADTEDNVIDFSSSFDVTEFYGEKELRWYQVATRNELYDALRAGILRICIVLPTGAGKTLTVACSLNSPEIKKILNIKDRPIRILFAAHTHRLLSQAEQTFAAETGVELIVQSIFSDIPQDVLDTGWDITVLDEAHHEACMSFQLMLDQIGDHPIVGLTATPDRADGCVIKFEKIIAPISREQAVNEGYLAPTYLNSIVDSPHKDKVEITKSVIDMYGHEFGQTMMFFRTKKEVTSITKYLTSKGYKAVAILNQSNREVDSILEDFSNQKIQFIINCNKINEGVDVKGCTDVYLGRSYRSYPQLNQVIGRAARPDSDCIVWELINPLSGDNLDTTAIVGTPLRHRLCYTERGMWQEREFEYVSNATGVSGIADSMK